ncbi:hypothetical protein TPHA_0A00870 [Tetrapisispora phaffii CBS 4417]|uniref:Protein NBA1 n=1 Tax=Tetrapisispora phaffii (strain ATCC 24235 / CBS 4417 / NBRC 1672 / NRRL Y-8282 / UCD 70-5) TaxID=1071381 RepID=G8BMP4_TETPH|nr:hypothetical protein TPHA_0A00870 [Tetrapisispora phaffii CBS 4417]CCE61172.1 hypothetical protein TPHA_0A00870 [Tetrapisispora phaffii CBS 4417]
MLASKFNNDSKVSVNSKRLSAMLDSLEDDDAVTFTTSNANKAPSKAIESSESSDLIQHVKLATSTENSNSSNSSGNSYDNTQTSNTVNSLSPATIGTSNAQNNRNSLISNYSGVIDERTEISFIVQNEANEQENNLDNIHSKHLISAKNSIKRNTSLRLTQIQGHKKDMSSIASGNMASESGSSAYYNIEKEHEVEIEKPLNKTELSDNSVNIEVPRRNKNRPMSRILLEHNLEEIENQLKNELDDMTKIDSPSNLHVPIIPESKNSSTVDVFYSATSLTNHNKHDDLPNSIIDESYLERPLPKSPYANNFQASSTERLHSETPELSHDITITRADNNTDNYVDQNDNDDDYEDIVDEAYPDDKNIQSTPQSKIIGNQDSTNTSSKNSFGNNVKEPSVSGFNIKTLQLLVDASKQNCLGNEFMDLGMKEQEKQSLQHLIDALSRLTADMVLDPTKYEQGLERLKKATRSLEGF